VVRNCCSAIAIWIIYSEILLPRCGDVAVGSFDPGSYERTPARNKISPVARDASPGDPAARGHQQRARGGLPEDAREQRRARQRGDHGVLDLLGGEQQRLERDLIDRLGGHHVVEFSVSGNSDGAALQAWRGLPSVESVRDDDGMVALNVKQPHLTIPALLETIDRQGSRLQHLTTRQASLEDVFVRLTGRHLREA